MSQGEELKVVISQGGTKRVLTGPFAICIGQQDLFALIKRLKEAAGAERIEDSKHYYGWITIYKEPEVPAVVNSEPIPWA